MISSEQKKWYLIEVLLLHSIVTSIYYGITNILIAFGLLMLVSPAFQDRLFSCKILYWFSMEVSSPQSKVNPFLWGISLIIFGFASKLKSSGESITNIMEKDLFFFLLNILVLLFALLATLISSRKNN